jgi:hypothetical protein
MLDVDARLELARAGDPRYQPVEGEWFAWRPVMAWCYVEKCHRRVWFERVRRFKALGLFWEYFRLNDPSPPGMHLFAPYISKGPFYRG